MKKLLLAFVLLLGLGLTAQAQRYVGTFVGNGAGLTNIPTSALSPNVVTNNGTLTLGLPIVGDGGRGGYPSNALTLSSATITTGVFETAYGDGSGITNIYAKNVITQTNNVSVGLVLDCNVPVAGYGTNNTVVVGGLTNWNAVQFNTTMLLLTNTAGPSSPIPITVPASFKDMNSGANPLYCTNVGQLLVWSQKNFGTNYFWKSR